MIEFTKRKLIIITLLFTTFNLVSQTNNDIEYYTKNQEKRLSWWKDSKFGMFIHWGIYSLPAGQWNSQRVKGAGEWLMFHAQVPLNEYKKLAKSFNPVEFNADEWVKLAKNSGMKYIVFTAKHVDGFSMYHSRVSDYNIVDATLFNRDPVKELKEACENHGIKFGLYYSHNWDWSEPHALGLQNTWDFPEVEKKDPDIYYTTKSYRQIEELMKLYHPDIIWFDVPTDITRQQSFDILKLVREINPDCIINDRISKEHKEKKMLMGDFYTTEQHVPRDIDMNFETCMTMNGTWGFQYHDNEWKNVSEIIKNIILHAHMGGNYLLNVGPDHMGNIPTNSVIILKKIGDWFEVNGESIYGTIKSSLTPFTTRDYIITTKPGSIYVHLMEWPHSRQLVIPEITADIKKISFLRDKEKTAINYQQNNTSDIIINLDPLNIPEDYIDPYITTLQVEYSGIIKKQELPPIVDLSHAASFYPEDAKIDGDLKYGFNNRWDENRGNEVQLWRKGGSFLWDFRTIRDGHYSVELIYGAHELSIDNDIHVELNGKTFKHKIMKAEGWYEDHVIVLGEIEFESDLVDLLKVSCSYSNNNVIANFKKLKLVPLQYYPDPGVVK